MANTQLVIVTPIPASLRLDPETISVSVLFSARLRGDDALGRYPDWLDWTARRRDQGLSLRFECAGRTLSVDVDTSSVRPELWNALFNENTFVRSHVFDHHSSSFVPSYSTRTALGLIQSAYQAAGVDLALPPADGDPRESIGRQRERLRSLLHGFAIDWNERTGAEWHDELRAEQKQQHEAGVAARAANVDVLAGLADHPLDDSGLIPTGALTAGSSAYTSAAQQVAKQYAVFNHQPQGADVTADSLDPEHVLDFHQALSAINAYRQLQRDLGLVFDLELPLDFVVQTTAGVPGDLAITGMGIQWDADTATVVPPTRTSYFHTPIGNRRLFCVAPLAMSSPRPLLAGLLDLDNRSFGVAQVDVDGALHKTLMHATNVGVLPGESIPATADVFDPGIALSSLRSGGITLFADSRALSMLDTFDRSRDHNADLEQGLRQKEAFSAEDLTRGYRLDIWDSATRQWHSLHRRDISIQVGPAGLEVDVHDEEGFFQAAATKAAPNADGTRANTDMHLHEAVARWFGWSLSAPSVGTHLTRSGDPDKALPDPAAPDPENEPVTPFVLRSEVKHVQGSLPRLRFGVGYRLRVRAVDLANNGLRSDDEECTVLTPGFTMPRGDGVIPYLRFEPVGTPVIVVRDTKAVSGEGSSADRLVIRTFNSDASKDSDAAVLDASDRHIAPPGVHVELAERHGMLDGPDGRIDPSPAMWELIRERDAGAFPTVAVPEIVIDGEVQAVPLDAADRVTALPYVPDPLARAAAFRDLPGTSGRCIGRVAPGAGADAPIVYEPLDDARPRPGTATIVEFGGREDWQQVLPFRFAVQDGDAPPRWDPDARVLTVALPKGTSRVVPMSSCCDPADLKYLGIWAWLREYVEHLTITGTGVTSELRESAAARDRLAHVLQLAVEGGHGMITPPHLLTLVSAVQQPIGRPKFSRLVGQVRLVMTETEKWVSTLQTEPETVPTAMTEAAVLASWRELGSTDAFLVGMLQVHGHSTAKVDLHAEWNDPFDDLVADPGERPFSAAVDEIPLPDLRTRRFGAGDTTMCISTDGRAVGYYVREHDLVAFAPAGTRLGLRPEGVELLQDTVPRHRIGDARHHIVTYTAIATSRFKDYFDAHDETLDFTRISDPVEVHVPASVRPLAPLVRYVVPTFGWDRVTSANQVRSVRSGGGLRIYLDRPWHSSGTGELLGVTVPSDWNLDRELWKGSITQWGEDPLWASTPLASFPGVQSFPDAMATETDLTLDTFDEISIPFATVAIQRRVDVAGHEVGWDPDRKLYYCDLTVDTGTATYTPFVRLALARYQPHALPDAKLSRVVLADFAQLTPQRALTVTADPYTPGILQITVSGPAPTGPVPPSRDPGAPEGPTTIRVTIQRKVAGVETDLGWEAAPGATVIPEPGDSDDPAPPEFVLWHGAVRFTDPGTEPHRLLVEEFETYLVDSSELHPDVRVRPLRTGRRRVYAETVPLDQALLSPPPIAASSTTT